MNLKEYIDTQIIPRYAAFDKAHREDHARAVIQRAMSMGERDAQKWRKEESEAFSRKNYILAGQSDGRTISGIVKRLLG